MADEKKKNGTDKRKGGGIKGKDLAIVGCVAGLVVGLIIGRFVLAPSAGNVTNLGKTTVSSDEMSQVVATYTYGGQSHTITLKDAIDYLGNTTNEDGSYNMPSADSLLSIARQNIIQDAASKQGIVVTDEEIEEYIKKAFSVESTEELASTFGYDVDQLKGMLTKTIMLEKFQKDVIGEQTEGPEAPAPEEESAKGTATKEYADYIVKLAGDKYKNGKWTDEGKDWAEAIKNADGKFEGGTADYNAAMAAYQMAYQDYATKYSEQQNQWTDYVNNIYKDSVITIATLDQ